MSHFPLTQITPQNFGFYVHGRGHSVAHESRELIYGFMDAHLKPPAATRRPSNVLDV